MVVVDVGSIDGTCLFTTDGPEDVPAVRNRLRPENNVRMPPLNSIQN